MDAQNQSCHVKDILEAEKIVGDNEIWMWRKILPKYIIQNTLNKIRAYEFFIQKYDCSQLFKKKISFNNCINKKIELKFKVYMFKLMGPSFGRSFLKNKNKKSSIKKSKIKFDLN